jgi:hypothetical protein
VIAVLSQAVNKTANNVAISHILPGSTEINGSIEGESKENVLAMEGSLNQFLSDPGNMVGGGKILGSSVVAMMGSDQIVIPNVISSGSEVVVIGIVVGVSIVIFLFVLVILFVNWINRRDGDEEDIENNYKRSVENENSFDLNEQASNNFI